MELVTGAPPPPPRPPFPHPLLSEARAGLKAWREDVSLPFRAVEVVGVNVAPDDDGFLSLSHPPIQYLF